MPHGEEAGNHEMKRDQERETDSSQPRDQGSAILPQGHLALNLAPLVQQESEMTHSQTASSIADPYQIIIEQQALCNYADRRLAVRSAVLGAR